MKSFMTITVRVMTLKMYSIFGPWASPQTLKFLRITWHFPWNPEDPLGTARHGGERRKGGEEIEGCGGRGEGVGERTYHLHSLYIGVSRLLPHCRTVPLTIPLSASCFCFCRILFNSLLVESSSAGLSLSRSPSDRLRGFLRTILASSPPSSESEGKVPLLVEPPSVRLRSLMFAHSHSDSSVGEAPSPLADGLFRSIPCPYRNAC